MATTVKSTVRIDDWINGEGKAVPKWKVELADGRSGECFSDVPVGTPDSDLQIEDKGKYGLKFKLIKKAGASGGFGGGKAKQDATPAFAISYAKDWVIAQLNKGVPVKTDDIIKVADMFLAWMDKNKR